MSKKVIIGGASFCSISVVIAILFNTIQSGEADYQLRTRKVFVENYTAVFEGCRNKSYLDTGGLETVGIGSTHYNCGKIISGKTYSDEEIAKRLNKDLWVAEQCVDRYFDGRNLPQNKYEAMVDFVFNLGCSKAIGTSKMTGIRKYALLGDYRRMCLEQLKWVKGRDRQGKFITLKGLKKRREEVAKWCLTEN